MSNQNTGVGVDLLYTVNLLEAPWGAGYGVEFWLDESERCLSWCAHGAHVSLPFSVVHVEWTEIV